MARIDRATRTLAATPAEVYRALVDPDALLRWLPPAGMTGHFERHDPRPGGGYRLRLTYSDARNAQGKSSADSDIVEVRYVELVPGDRVVEAVDFVSDDPAFAGTMRMTWTLTAKGQQSEVAIAAEDVPSGISAADHIAGMTSSLDNLARYLANRG